MAGGFDSGVSPPGGASYSAPLLKFDQFANWANDFQQGVSNSQQQETTKQQQQLNQQRIADEQRKADIAQTFKGGLPIDPRTGQPDYAKAVAMLAQKGDINAIWNGGDIMAQQELAKVAGAGLAPQPGAQPASIPARPLPAPSAGSPQGDPGQGTIASLVTDRLPGQDANTGQTIGKIAQTMGVDANATLTPGQLRRAQGLLQKYAPGTGNTTTASAGDGGASFAGRFAGDGGGNLPPSANAGSPAPPNAPPQGARPASPPSGQPQQPAQPQAAPIGSGNLPAADASLRLTPQEKALYRRHLTNLTGSGGVDNPDGTRSTLKDITVESGGKTYVIPTVYDGKIVSNDDAWKRAKTHLKDFPAYASEAEANARYDAMHGFMNKDTVQFMGARGQQPSNAAPRQGAPVQPPQAAPIGAGSPQGQPGAPVAPQAPQGGPQPPQPQPQQPLVPQVPLPKGFTDPMAAAEAYRAKARQVSAMRGGAGLAAQYNAEADRIEASIRPVSVGPTTTMVDPRTGQPIYQGPAAALMSGAAGRSETVESDAEVYRQTGKMPAGIARTPQGQAEAHAIRQLAREKEIAEGGDPAEWSNRWQSFATQASGKRALETRAAGLSLAENEASSLIPRVREISGKIERTKYPTLNSLILASQKGSGGTDVIKLGIAIESLVPVYARVLKPVGQVGQGDMARAHDILDKAWSDGQINAALDQMQVELKSARSALDKTMADSESRGRTKKETTPAAAQPGASTSTTEWVRGPDGKLGPSK